MKTHIDRLWHASDILFLTGLAVAMFLGSKVTPLLVVAGVLPIPLLLRALKTRHYHVSIWTLLGPATIYFCYGLLTLLFFTGLDETYTPPVNPSIEFYAIAVAMLAVGLVRGLQCRDLALRFNRLMPWLLIFCFVVLSYMMFAGIRENCRVRGWAPWPFIPALLFSTLTFMTLVGWRKLSSYERWLRVCLLALSIVVSTTYTGSRGVAVGQLGVFCVLLLLATWPSLRNSVPGWRHLTTAISAGLLLSVAVAIATDCGTTGRFSSALSLVKQLSTQLIGAEPKSTLPAPAVEGQLASPEEATTTTEPNTWRRTTDGAINERLAMWETSITAIKESPLIGHGSLYLQKLIHATYGYEHNHNQYLTWLVTGGVLQLTLGLIFLAIPLFVSQGLSIADRLLLTIGVSLFWGIAMMFDSFLNLKFYTHYFCLLCGVLYALSNSMQDSADT